MCLDVERDYHGAALFFLFHPLFCCEWFKADRV